MTVNTFVMIVKKKINQKPHLTAHIPKHTRDKPLTAKNVGNNQDLKPSYPNIQIVDIVENIQKHENL